LRAQRFLRVHAILLPAARCHAYRNGGDCDQCRQQAWSAPAHDRIRRRCIAGTAQRVWHRSGHPLHSAGGACNVKIIVIVGLVAVIASLFSALYYLYRDRGHGERMVKALAIRVALSATLVLFLVVSYKMGWIAPTGLH
jgi:hypothetical protein